MLVRSAALLFAFALASSAQAQDYKPLYLGAGIGAGQALGETLAVPYVAIGYAPRGGGVQAEAAAGLAGQVRRRYDAGPDDRMRRHIRLAARLAYAVPLAEQIEVDAGVHASGSLFAEIDQCGGTRDCDATEGYLGIGPMLGATASFGRLGVRASAGYTQSSVDDVFGGVWARLGLRYRP